MSNADDNGFLSSGALLRFASTLAENADREALAFDEQTGMFWDPVDEEEIQ